MLGVQHYISSLKQAIYVDRSQSASAQSNSSFHLFPQLPAELRRKIYAFALPQRIMEAKLCRRDNTWHYYCIKPAERLDARKMPTLFSVSVETREFCLEQYVVFANHYVHPVQDILYISWHLHPAHATSIAVEGRPLDKFQNVVISVAQNRLFSSRFGSMYECLKSLGSPKEISLGLDGPKLPRMLSDMRGYSTATGHQVILLLWNTDTESNSEPDTDTDSEPVIETRRKTLQGEVSDAFRLEEQATPNLTLPKIKERMLYIYSGP